MGAACCSRRQRAQPQAPAQGQPLLQEQPLAAEAAWHNIVRRWRIVQHLRRAAAASHQWCRYELRLRNVRKLQRIWAYTGHYLQQYPDELRTRLVRVYPKIHD